MAGDGGGEFFFFRAQIFLAPEVADALRRFFAEAELRPRGGNFLRLLREVEVADGAGAVRELFHVDLFAAVDEELRGGGAEFVLVEREDFVVGEEAEREVVGFFERAADEERRGEEAPEAEVRVLLVGREARGADVFAAADVDGADDEHVGIVPVAGAAERAPFFLLEPDVAEVAPRVADVAGGAPGIRERGERGGVGKGCVVREAETSRTWKRQLASKYREALSASIRNCSVPREIQ